jgi:hypothetical protein
MVFSEKTNTMHFPANVAAAEYISRLAEFFAAGENPPKSLPPNFRKSASRRKNRMKMGWPYDLYLNYIVRFE